MNPGQDASPDRADAEALDDEDANADTDHESDIDPEIDPDIDTESLRRSRDAIDQGREAAREALPDDADAAGDPEG